MKPMTETRKTVDRKWIVQRAVLAALMHHKPDYRSPLRLDKAASVIADFVEAELNKSRV